MEGLEGGRGVAAVVGEGEERRAGREGMSRRRRRKRWGRSLS